MNRYLLALSLGLVSANAWSSQTAHAAIFTMPRQGDTIQSREDFAVSVEINDFGPNGTYWVAIASVTGHEETWDRVLELRERIKHSKDSAARSELSKLVEKWPITLFWPKFYVPENPYEGRIFDGGTNPLRGLEPYLFSGYLSPGEKIRETVSCFCR